MWWVVLVITAIILGIDSAFFVILTRKQIPNPEEIKPFYRLKFMIPGYCIYRYFKWKGEIK